MKRTLGLVLFVFAVGVVTVMRGQAPQDSIDIGGVRLKIGMPENIVLQQLGASFDLHEGPAGEAFTEWLITVKGSLKSAVGNVCFQASKLSCVYKNWTVNEPRTEAGFANALYGAVSSFEGEGRTKDCTLETGQSLEPTMQRKDVSIICGHKRLYVNVFKIGKEEETASISEILR